MKLTIDNIPVNQTANATTTIKNFLLEKFRKISENRRVLDQMKIQQQQRHILESYRKSVGFDKKLTAMKKAQDQFEKAHKVLMELGLNPAGDLLQTDTRKVINEDGHPGLQHRYYDGDTWNVLPTETIERIDEVRKLIQAVSTEMEVFSRNDQLETRMMLATTVGECMAIINEIAGRDVFALEDEKIMAIKDRE